MLKQEETSCLSGGGNNSWARACDTCRSAACTVYCKADSAYLCSSCDARIHAANKVASRHERVWVCEACERAPAAFLCKADAASLCATCDSDIHSANPLARRHHRVPIMPISGNIYGSPPTDPGGGGAHIFNVGHTHRGGEDDVVDDGFLTQDGDQETIDEDDEDEAASWLLLNPVKGSNSNNQEEGNNNNGMMFVGGEGVDEYLDLVDYNSYQENQFADHHHHYHRHHHQYNKDQQQQHYAVPHKSFGGDSVVPIRGAGEGKDHQLQHQHHPCFQLGLDYEVSSTGYGYTGSTSHSVRFLMNYYWLV